MKNFRRFLGGLILVATVPTAVAECWDVSRFGFREDRDPYKRLCIDSDPATLPVGVPSKFTLTTTDGDVIQCNAILLNRETHTSHYWHDRRGGTVAVQTSTALFGQIEPGNGFVQYLRFYWSPSDPRRKDIEPLELRRLCNGDRN